MKNSRQLLTSVSIILIGAILASGIFFLFSGERGWVKFIGWVIFFASIQSPFFLSRYSNMSCSFLARLKKRS